MRRFRTRRHLRRHECHAVIEATALLCAKADIRWTLATGTPVGAPVSAAALAEELLRCRREGRPFLLPEACGRWLDLRYANPDTGYALAILLLWSMGATRPFSGPSPTPTDPVGVAMWELRHLLTPSAHRALGVVEAAFRRAAGLMAYVAPAPAPGT